MTIIQFDDDTAIAAECVLVVKRVRPTPESLQTQVFIHTADGKFFEVQCTFEEAVAKLGVRQ